MNIETPEPNNKTGQQNEKLTASGYLTLLRNNRNYRFLWLAQVVSLLGDWFSLVAVVTLVTRYAGTAEALSGLFIFRLVPMVLFGSVAGVLADRFNRRNLMIIADFSRALIALSFLLVNSASNLWLLYVLTLTQFSLATLFDPARSALIPAVTSPEERVTANALGALTWSSLLAIGAALGGLTTGLVGVEISFVVDALSFVLSALLIWPLPAKLAQACGGKCEKLQLGADLKAGFGYIKARPPIFAYTLIKPLSALSSGALFAILALQAHNVYPLGQDGSLSLGLLNLAIGVGSGLGPLLGVVLLRRVGETRANLQKVISAGFIFYGVGLILFSNSNILLVAVLAIMLGDLGGGSNWVYSTTLLQLSVTEEFRGRVFAVEMMLSNLLSVLSALVGGYILDQLHLAPQMVGAGLGILQLFIGVIWLVSALKAHRKPASNLYPLES